MLSGDYDKAYNDLSTIIQESMLKTYRNDTELHYLFTSCVTEITNKLLRDFTRDKNSRGKVKGKLNKNVALSISETSIMKTFGGVHTLKELTDKIKTFKKNLKNSIEKLEKKWRQ